MRATSSLLEVKNIYKRDLPCLRSWGGIVPSLESKKPGNEQTVNGTSRPNENADPVVAFSRLPSLPPVAGPMMALLLEE